MSLLLTDVLSRNQQIPKEWGQPLAQAFLGLESKEKNALIDQFQNRGLIPKFLGAMPKFTESFLRGLNRENAQFIQTTFEHLAKAAEMRKEVEQAIAYSEEALHVKGWIENNFRK